MTPKVNQSSYCLKMKKRIQNTKNFQRILEESEPKVKSKQAQPTVEIAEEIYHQNLDAG